MIGLSPLLIVALAPALMQPAEPPVTFAREGQELAIRVAEANQAAPTSVVLSAFGRNWTRSKSVSNGLAQIAAPKVRVPTSFQLGVEKGRALGEVVVYPAHYLSWNDHVRLMACDAPTWFPQWAAVVGLPLENLQSSGAPKQEIYDATGKLWNGRLLVIGPRMAGANPAAAWTLADKYGANLLVLDASWFGPSQPFARVEKTGAKSAAPRIERPNIEWPEALLPPRFDQHRLPYPGVTNRQGWVVFEGDPLVEELRTAQKVGETRRIVVSYVPWQQRIGRDEATDRALLEVMTEAAKPAAGRALLDGRLRVLHPDPATIRSTDRPVLAAAIAPSEPKPSVEGVSTKPTSTAVAYVLDLRGTVRQSVLEEHIESIKAVENRVDRNTPLLILGDDPWLDQRKWIKLDRAHARSQRAGVFWWPEKALPGSSRDQWRLMEFLTDRHIALRENSQER